MASGGLSRMSIGTQCRELKKLFRPAFAANDTRGLRDETSLDPRQVP